jgi:BatD DUF11 like domain
MRWAKLLLSTFLFIFKITIAQDLPATLLKNGENAEAKAKEYLFCKIETDKTSAYVGEPIVVTYKLYSALNSNSYISNTPNYDGFSTYEVKLKTNKELVKIKGVDYNCHTIKELQIYPTASGQYTLHPMTVYNDVTLKKYLGRKDIKDIQDMLQHPEDYEPKYEMVKLQTTFTTNAVTITAKPLPSTTNKYNSAVGKFRLTASVDNKNPAINESVVVSYTLNGKGNMQMINEMPVAFPNTIEVITTSIEDQIDSNAVPFEGKKIFKYTIIAKDSGKIKLPKCSFVYFNIATGKYETTIADSMILDVKKEVKKNKIVTNENERVSPIPWYQNKDSLIVIGFIIAVLVGVGIYFSRKKKRAVVMAPPVVEVVEEVKPFVQTKNAIALNKQQQALVYLRSELLEAVAKKIKMPNGTNYMQLHKNLQYENESHATEFKNIMNKIDQHLFANDVNMTNVDELLLQAENLLN